MWEYLLDVSVQGQQLLEVEKQPPVEPQEGLLVLFGYGETGGGEEIAILDKDGESCMGDPQIFQGQSYSRSLGALVSEN